MPKRKGKPTFLAVLAGERRVGALAGAGAQVQVAAVRAVDAFAVAQAVAAVARAVGARLARIVRRLLFLVGLPMRLGGKRRAQRESPNTNKESAKLSFISIQISIHFDDQFFLIYFKTKLLRINLKVEHCGAFYAPSKDIC